MERLLASRDSRRRRGGAEDSDYEEEEVDQEELQPMAYRDAWAQARQWGESDRASSRPAPASPMSGYDYDERDEDGDPQYEGWGSSGFSSAQSGVSGSGGGAGRGQMWERVSGVPKPRRRRPAARKVELDEAYGDRRMREAARERNGGEGGSEWGWRDDVGHSSMPAGRERDSR